MTNGPSRVSSPTSAGAVRTSWSAAVPAVSSEDEPSRRPSQAITTRTPITPAATAGAVRLPFFFATGSWVPAQLLHFRPAGERTKQEGQMGVAQLAQVSRVGVPSRAHLRPPSVTSHRPSRRPRRAGHLSLCRRAGSSA